MPSEAQKDQEFLTQSQLCERWHCTPETLRNYRKEGKLRPSRPGGKWLYRVSEIQKIESYEPNKP